MKKYAKRMNIGFVILLLIGSIAITCFTGREVFDGIFNIISREETISSYEKYNKSEYEEFKKKYNVNNIDIYSSKGNHTIPAIYVNNNGNGTAVLVHGLGGTKESVTHAMKVFLDLNYNVIAYDQRSSGANVAPYNTFGVLESYDTLDVIDYVKEKLDTNGELILWGESLGGSTAAITVSRDDSKIDYIILDCPLADSRELVEQELVKVEKEEGIPVNYMYFAGNLWTRLKLGFSFDEIDASKCLEKTMKPVLITNSSIDEVTPGHMGKQMYDAIKHNKKEIYTMKNYGHIQFSREETDEYKSIIKEFLEKY